MTKKSTKGDAVEGEIVETKPKKTKAVAKRATAEMSIVAGVTSAELETALKVQTEQRALIKDFVKKHLKKDVDFGQIHVVSSCQAESNRRGTCKNMGHFSKPVLYKPGQEKIFSLFNLTSKMERDQETLDMIPNAQNTIAYKCLVYRGDKLVAEGRGAATIGDKKRDVNSTIKIAEKRARMDAALSLGFSEYFAQDLDDPDYAGQREMANEQARHQAEAAEEIRDDTGMIVRPPEELIDNEERGELYREFLKNNIDGKEAQHATLKANGIENPLDMTSGQARDMILKLRNNIFVQGEVPETPPQAPPEATIVVDDEFKGAVEEQLATLNLSTRGVHWFMKETIGKPFAKLDKITDNEWRRIYEYIMWLRDNHGSIPEEYKNAGQQTLPIDFSVPTKDQPSAEPQNNDNEGESQNV
jgi:hypothetical protein